MYRIQSLVHLKFIARSVDTDVATSKPSKCSRPSSSLESFNMKLYDTAIAAAVICSVSGRAFNTHYPSTDVSYLLPDSDDPYAKLSTPSLSFANPAHGFDGDDIADDEDWAKYTSKGGALMCGLRGTDQTAGSLMNDRRNPPSAASIWNGDLRQELHTWYWRHIDPATYSCKINDHWNFASALKSLGLNGKPTAEGGDNTCFRVEHWDPSKQENGHQVPAINQWYKVGDKEYRVS